MLVKNFSSYLLARGLPGLINFLAMAIYTRLLTPGEFGRYAFALSVVGFLHVVSMQSLQLVLMRFYPQGQSCNKLVLNHVLFAYLLGSCIFLITGLVIALLFLSGQGWSSIILLSTVLLVSQGWHEINLQMAASTLNPVRYGYLGAGKAILAIAVGSVMAWLGMGANAPVIGLSFGCVIAWVIWGRDGWQGVNPSKPGQTDLKAYTAYGLPLIATFAVVWVVSSSDRVLISYFLGEAATGVYAVGYDLAQNSLGLLLAVVNTAATPLVIKAYEEKGKEAAKVQMKHNGELIFSLAFSGFIGLVIIGPEAIRLFVGEAFREGALLVFPWIALSAAVVGIKSFYFDIVFHLAKASKNLVLTNGLAAIINVVLNIVFIPAYGILGAAIATLFAFLCAAVMSNLIGRRIFDAPSLIQIFSRSAVVAIGVGGAAVCVQLVLGGGAISLCFTVLASILVFISLCWKMNISNIRNFSIS